MSKKPKNILKIIDKVKSALLPEELKSLSQKDKLTKK